MNTQPLVSIFIPYYNDENFLHESIESVLDNQYQNFELILLNHASTDSCRTIAHSYKDSRIKHIDMEINLGGGSGLLFKKMLDISKGKYIKVVCADDTLRKDGLCTLVNYIEENPQYDFIFGNVEYINVKGKDLMADFFSTREYFSTENSEADCIRLLAKGQGFLPWAGALIKKEILDSIDINKTYIYCFDINLWLTLFCKGYRAGYVNKLVANYRIHPCQASALNAIDKVAAFATYEHKTYYKPLFTIKDISLVKEIWPNSRFVNSLKDTNDIPFFIAHNLFWEESLEGNTAEYIDNLLNDNKSRKHLEKTFGYGIKEYREDILTMMKKRKNKSSNVFCQYKSKVYSKSIKKLDWSDLIFLFLRKLFNLLTLHTVIQKYKQRKRKKFSL